MTRPEFGGAGLSEVELDRLADWTAGALESTDAAEVARLVATDPRWSQAHALLVEADQAVRDDLLAASAPAPAMPLDVVARIEAALRDASSGSVIPLDPTRARPSTRTRSRSSSRRRSDPRRRHNSRILAIAAAVIAVAGGLGYALTQVPSVGGSATSAAPALDSAEGDAGPGQVAAPNSGALPRVVVTDTNYTRTALAALGAVSDTAAEAPPGLTSGGNATRDAPFPVPDVMKQAIPGPLARLTAPAALSACLSAVVQAHPGAPVSVEFARFDGQPALIILLRTNGASTVVAVGPDCGLAGADEKAAVGP